MLLRRQLAKRIRLHAPAAWDRFARLWTSFNAIYGGEVDPIERSRVMDCIRQGISEQRAQRLLQECKASIENIVATPPGDMRKSRLDPRFRAATTECVNIYRDDAKSSIERLSAFGGVLYQVRCNLVHGSKDPDIERDRMLVEESIAILEPIVLALEEEPT